MLSHYIDLSAHGDSILFELFGRVLKVVHLSACDGKAVAVDWPMWREAEGGFGPVVRLLGPQTSIEHCLQKLTPLLEAGLLIIRGPIGPVPANATHSYGYRRNRKQDALSPSHQRRLERRALARGEVYQSTVAGGEKRRTKHHLPMQSKSSGMRFSVFIERVPAEDLTSNTPGSYGFDVAVPSF